MIREEEIREFQEIIGIIGRRAALNSDVEEDDDFHETYPYDNEDFIDAREEEYGEDRNANANSYASDISGNTLILYITTTFGLIFLASVIFGVLMFVYGAPSVVKDKKEIKNSNDNSNSDSSKQWRMPGYRKIITDPDAGEENIRVWGIRTALPPKPYTLYLYYRLHPEDFKDEFHFFKESELI